MEISLENLYVDIGLKGLKCNRPFPSVPKLG